MAEANDLYGSIYQNLLDAGCDQRTTEQCMTFAPSFGGESGGEVRNMASPEIFTEDYSAAVDYVGLLPYVDRDRIGAIGICGLSGMAITAAGTDTRIKAVATLSMYDMSRDKIGRAHV